MPAGYRRLLYMKRDEAPAYPGDADSLLQVRNWPATVVIEGELYDLEFGSGLNAMVGQPVCCLSSIRPGWNYSTQYVRRSAPRDPERSYLRPLTMLGGPSYS